MDIVTIYAQPDIDNPLKAFEGLMKSFKKYGFRSCDKLKLVVPNGSREKLAKFSDMLNLIGEGHELIPIMYPTLRSDRISFSAYHNNILCRAVRSIKGQGRFVYIPFGCEPLEKGWGKTVETVATMHSEKSFIGETRQNSDGYDYLSGVCVLDYSFFSEGVVFQAVNAKCYPFSRAARSYKGDLLSYPLPFSDLDFGDEKEFMSKIIKGLATHKEKKAEKHIKDVPDEVSDETEEKLAEFVAPEVIPEPEVIPDVLGELSKSISETKEEPVSNKTVEKLPNDDLLMKEFSEMHHLTFIKLHGKELYDKLKKKKKASSKKAKKKTAKKAKKKASKKTAISREAKKQSDKSTSKAYGINAKAKDVDRIDHSV